MTSKIASFLKLDILVPLLLMLYSATYFIEVNSLSNAEQAILLIKPIFYILLIASLLQIVIQIFLFFKSKGESIEVSEVNDEGKHEAINYRKSIIFILTTLLYVFLVDVIGFFVVTFIFVSYLMFELETRNIKLLILVPLILILILYLGLEVGLGIHLPDGILI